ncbi:MAG: ATP-binding protein [Bacteroidales bacterium]|jgi:signal transduction histidine kinase|nr:ATP-binding protein [Bacteroidales bacterium]MCI2145442.1 ATP-binding protein [Bacteroidales bacterium]
MKFNFKDTVSFIKKNVALCIGIVAAILFVVSFMVSPESVNCNRAAGKLESHLHARQRILEKYVRKAGEMPPDQWISFDNFPDDMVLYRYNSDPFYGDTLQSWINRFPVSNDEIDILPVGYRLNYLSSSNLYSTPLAYIGNREQYVNLGSAWYVVKCYSGYGSRIIAGVLIKNENLNEKSTLTYKVNPKLHLDKHLTTMELNSAEGALVKGIEGDALFTISFLSSQHRYSSLYILRWLALMLAVVAILAYHIKKRSILSMFVAFAVTSIVNMLAVFLSVKIGAETKFFSPILYADSTMFHSLGNLLLSNLYVAVMVYILFLTKRAIERKFFGGGKAVKIIIRVLLIGVPLVLCVYIHMTLRSLLMNSSLVLDLSRYAEINFYSIICYLSYALLLAMLLFSLQMIMPLFGATRKINLFSVRNILIFSCLVTLYFVLAVNIFGLKREYEQNRVWTNKLSIERDLTLELQLCEEESNIAQDKVIEMLSGYSGSNGTIRERLLARYLEGPLMQNYNVTVTTCGEHDLLKVERNSTPIDCFGFYQDEIEKYGTPVLPNSHFYFMNNYNGRIGYIGVFTYPTVFRYNSPKVSRLFIEIDSKYIRDDIGYPLQLFAYKQNDKIKLPRYYSHADYINGRLQSFEGNYNYPITFRHEIRKGYFKLNYNGYVHFINCVSEDNIIVISRQRRSILPFLVTFSYLLLFYGIIILLMTGKARRDKMFYLPRHSFRSRITILLSVSLVFSLLCLGIGSIMLSLSQTRNVNRQQMREKLQTVQSTLTDYCKYALRYNDINTSELFDAMERVAYNTQSDINLYDPHGLLVRTTKAEVFEHYLLGCRINPEAYNMIINNDAKRCVLMEEIAGIRYYSLYAPIFNAEGLLVSIVNIPYFSRMEDMEDSVSDIVAAIINIYLLLLIASLLGGFAVSNSLSKPMEEISRKMQRYDVTQKVEHIDYKGNDEIGMLVTSYNKMVDDLDESTKRLAKTERDQAWREMARQIAHEIKNPLTPMRLSIQQLMRLKKLNYPGWQDKLNQVFDSLLEQIEILSQTATEFSSFAKFYNEEVSKLNLNDLLRDEIVLYNNDDSIKVKMVEKVKDAMVMARKSQMLRVFVNLLSNAMQAIKNEGIKIGVVMVTIRRAGTFYEIVFEDNGPGVLPENRDKLFKPNFTTKSSGTGLGLAICRSIVEQSSGSIRYETSAFGGAAFIIDLPAVTCGA